MSKEKKQKELENKLNEGVSGKSSTEEKSPETPKMVQIPEQQLLHILDKLKMLEAVADKGRVFNYESNQPQKKAMKVKLGVFKGGNIIKWRTVMDELVQHPTTGEIVGEKQEYEIEVLTKPTEQLPAGEIKVFKLASYKQFSDARYDNREEADVIGKKEDWNGNITYSVKLNDGRVVDIDSRFIN